MRKILIIVIMTIALIGVRVKALTIATTENIEETNGIINIAINKDKQLFTKRYMILKSLDKIYMIVFKKEEYTQVNNEVIINHGLVISKEGNVVNIEEYDDIDITIHNEVYTNIEIENGKVNMELEIYRDRKSIIGIAIIGVVVLIGIIFTKEMI